MTDRVALITGGASGIGRATARKFAENDCHVVVVDLNAAMGGALVAGVSDDGLSAEFHQCDVRDARAVATLFDGLGARHSRLDHAVNAVGGGMPGAEGPFDEIGLGRWRQERATIDISGGLFQAAA